MEKFKDDIEKIVKELGGTFTGFSYVQEKLPQKLKAYPYAVTVGIHLSEAIIDEIDDKPTFTYFNHYRSVNSLIDQILLRIVLYLQDCGYKAYSIPASQSIPDSDIPFSAVFPHKTAAVRAGLGWIGKNGLFISSRYGPRVRLGTILTDAQLPVTDEVLESRCGSCRKCVESCPAMALTGNCWKDGCERERVVDAKACSEYMNKHFKHIGRGSVCGICIKVCPRTC
ncbi:MAG: epoxyqueuosine reductase [Bacillota bacterium]|nr:epoxyqueuosine reductase [Bacillota bacterium]